MAKQQPAGKRLQINKANSTIVAALAISSFIVVFSLVAGKALTSQRAYQSRVIAKKEQARDQLKTNLNTTASLITAYKNFVGTNVNVLGGDPNGNGDKDGDNAKIILDALPSKYDFPALTTSIEKLIGQRHIKVNSITGSDEEIAQSSQQMSNTPAPVEMPFEVSVAGNYGAIQGLIKVFESSIRPFNIATLTFTGTDSNLQLDMTAKTYYQPEKDLTTRTVVVK